MRQPQNTYLISILMLIFGFLCSISTLAQDVTYSVACPDTVQAGVPITFTVNVPGVAADVKLTRRWSLSTGEIKSGQGTSSIVVDSQDLGGQKVTATVVVDEIPPELISSASCSVEVVPLPITEITLERKARCLPRRRCSNYKVTLKSDNTVTYVGYPGNDKERGEYTGSVEFAPIAAQIESMGFFSLQDASDIEVRDAGEFTVSVTRAGTRQEVRSLNPPESPVLNRISNEIEKAISRVRWGRLRR